MLPASLLDDGNTKLNLLFALSLSCICPFTYPQSIVIRLRICLAIPLAHNTAGSDGGVPSNSGASSTPR